MISLFLFSAIQLAQYGHIQVAILLQAHLHIHPSLWSTNYQCRPLIALESEPNLVGLIGLLLPLMLIMSSVKWILEDDELWALFTTASCICCRQNTNSRQSNRQLVIHCLILITFAITANTVITLLAQVSSIKYCESISE